MPTMNRRTFLQAGAAVGLAVAVGDLFPDAMPTASAAAAGSPPSLDQMAGDWLPVTGLVHYPETGNFWGGLELDTNITGFQRLAMPPYSQGGSGFDTTFDGSPLASAYVRWYPYQIQRLAETASGLVVLSTTRMAFEANQVLITVSVANPTDAQVSTNVSVALDPVIRKYTSGWDWQIPRPSDTNFTAQLVGTAPNQNLLVSDKTGPAVTAVALSPAPQGLAVSGIGANAAWTLSLAPGQTTVLDIVIAIGDTSTGAALVSSSDASAVLSAANTTLSSFASVYAAAESGWSTRWSDAFTPGNGHYSGSLPTISTDHPAIDRLYYMSVLSVICTERTNLGPSFNALLGRTGGFSGFERIYTTGDDEFGGTTMFFWDTSYASVVLSLLDPAMFSTITSYFLTMDIYDCYAVDAMSGNGVGNYYSANDLTVSTSILNYVKLSGNWAYLSSTAAGSTVLQHLTTSATYWQGKVPSGYSLADYGASVNLLEVLPNYTNMVVSLNAGNVWLMREIADLQNRSGNTSESATLTTAATNLLPHVLALYVSGQGVWNCQHDDGSLVTVRTVVDLCIGANSIATDLTSTQQSEIQSFVTNELLDGNWMRALSLKDSEAPVDRADHGSTGAYEAWPALTAQTFMRFGDYASGLGLLNTFSGVTSQGPFGQAHQLAPGRFGYRTVDHPSLDPTGAITLAAWIDASSWPANIWQASILAKDDFSNNAGYVLRGGNGGKLSFVIYTGGGNYTELQTTTALSAGTHHVAATFNGSSMTIYADGAQIATQAVTAQISPSTVDLIVGDCPSDTTRQFDGAIDGAQVYSRALSASEVSAAHAKGNPFAGDDPAIVLHVPMQLGLPNPYPDSTALNPTGAFTLSAWINATAWQPEIWQGSIIAKDDFDDNAGYVLRGGAGGLLSFVFYTGGGNYTELQTTSPVSSGWHYVAATFDGSAMHIYVDGALQATQAQSTPVSASTGTGVLVGNCPSDMARQFLGQIVDARIYTRALAASEVSSIHSAGNTFATYSDPAMQLWYPPITGPSAAVPDVGLIASDNPMVYYGTEGGAFAGVIITDLFGYAPTGQAIALTNAAASRGLNGTLSGLTYNAETYTITSASNGVSIG